MLPNDEKSIQADLRAVPAGALTSHSEYREMFSVMLRETAARLIQRSYRRKANRSNPHYYDETLTGTDPLTLHFIKEPQDDTYLAHAKQIHDGPYLGLDFSDKELVRNIYKALRLNQIKSHQLATAILLYLARDAFADPSTGNTHIQQFSYHDAGPFSLSNIAYANKEAIVQTFNQSLQELPAHEAVYFAVNLHHEHTIQYLHESLRIGTSGGQLANLKHLLKKHIERLPLTEQVRQTVLSAVDTLSTPDNYCLSAEMCHCPTCPANLLRFIKQQHPTVLTGNDNIDCLISGIRLDEQAPTVALAPNYDSSNPNSPLIALIIPTVASLEKMLIAMYGEHASLPFFTVGQFSPSFVRQADEGDVAFSTAKQRRVVELPHPDIIGTRDQHGFMTHPFFVIHHDLLFHTFRNSAFILKPFVRDIRKMLEREKGFYMSRPIWRLSDLDISAASQYLSALDEPTKQARYKKLLQMAIQYAFTNFKTFDPHHFHDLLLIADMLRRRKTWEKLTDTTIENIILLLFPGQTAIVASSFQKMKAIIENDADQNQARSSSDYVLRYALAGHPKAEQIYNQLQNTDIVAWHRNEGMYIHSRYSAMGKNANLNNAAQHYLVSQLEHAIKAYHHLETELNQPSRTPKIGLFSRPFNSTNKVSSEKQNNNEIPFNRENHERLLKTGQITYHTNSEKKSIVIDDLSAQKAGNGYGTAAMRKIVRNSFMKEFKGHVSTENTSFPIFYLYMGMIPVDHKMYYVQHVHGYDGEWALEQLESGDFNSKSTLSGLALILMNERIIVDSNITLDDINKHKDFLLQLQKKRLSYVRDIFIPKLIRLIQLDKEFLHIGASSAIEMRLSDIGRARWKDTLYRHIEFQKFSHFEQLTPFMTQAQRTSLDAAIEKRNAFLAAPKSPALGK